MASKTTNCGPYSLSSLKESLGWSAVGVCSPEVDSETQDYFLKWLEEKKGPQMGYLERRQKERLNPKSYFPEVQSVLCFALYYFPGWAKGDVKVSNYSWGQDYHYVLSHKLKQTADELKKTFPQMRYRVCVDTAPVLEKYFAVKAGIGWQGKNTLVMNTQHGSTFFLGEIFCNLPVESFQAPPLIDDHCGKCRRCIDACPTDALLPYELQADRCISYWTLEHKGAFGEETPDWESWIAGCDICQEVCPWNRKLIPVDDLSIDPDFQNLDFSDFEDFQEWKQRIKAKAVDYVKEENWHRNLKKLKAD